MSLDIYTEQKSTKKISSTNPFRVTFDGRVGGHFDQPIYIRNNETNKYYTNITLTVSDSGATDYTDGSVDGFEWKLLKKDVAPTNREWDSISAGNTVTLLDNGTSSFADITTYQTVWVRVSIPSRQGVENKVSISFDLTATEYII